MILQRIEIIKVAKSGLNISTSLVRMTQHGAVHAILLVVGLLWLAPSLGLFVTAWRSPEEIATSGWWTALFTWRFTAENFSAVLEQTSLLGTGLGDRFINTLIITTISTIFSVLTAAGAAYAFAWLKFPGRNVLYLLVIALLAVPLQITWISNLTLLNRLNLTNSYFGISLIHTAYAMPFATFMLRNFFSELPKEVFESAKIDGASAWGIFWRILLPLSIPALASLVIFQVVWVWNDLIHALIFLADASKHPITVGVQSLLGIYGGEWNLVAAATWMSAIIPLTVFLLLQRYFVRGVTVGAVKG